jgi:hypothetical protein
MNKFKPKNPALALLSKSQNLHSYILRSKGQEGHTPLDVYRERRGEQVPDPTICQ